MPQHTMGRHGGAMIARCLYELAELQRHECGLHRTFGKPGFIGQHAQTRSDRVPSLTGSAAGKIQVNKKGRGLLIVSDDIAHEHVENVIIDRHGLAKARHGRIVAAIPIIGQDFSRQREPCLWTPVEHTQ